MTTHNAAGAVLIKGAAPLLCPYTQKNKTLRKVKPCFLSKKLMPFIGSRLSFLRLKQRHGPADEVGKSRTLQHIALKKGKVDYLFHHGDSGCVLRNGFLYLRTQS